MKVKHEYRGLLVEQRKHEDTGELSEITGFEISNSDQFIAALTLEQKASLLAPLLDSLNLPRPNYVTLLQGAVRAKAPVLFNEIMRDGANAMELLNKFLSTSFTGKEPMDLCVCTWLKLLKEKS